MNAAVTHPPRVGLIGAGAIAGVHIQGWLALGADVLVTSSSGAEELTARYGGRVVADLEDLWPQVDLVDIVTPTYTHAEIALTAIAAGKDVVCEKPLALDSGTAAKIVRAADDAGVHLFPAHVVRYFPQYAAAHAAVSAGAVGKVAVSRFRRMSAAPLAPWFFDEAASGGLVLDQMIHDLDQARLINGPVASVFARSTSRTGEEGTTASATVTLTHTSGAISYCYGVWGHPGLPFTYSFDIAGDAGNLSYDYARDDTTRVSISGPAGSGGYVPAVDPAESPYTTQLADFLAVIRGEVTPTVTGADGVEAVMLAEAAIASIASGQPEPIAERSHS